MDWENFLRERPSRWFWQALCTALAGGLCLLGAAPAFAQNVAIGHGQATVTVVSRLSLIKKTDLDFGSIIATTIAGTVVISPAGVRSRTGGVAIAGSSFNAAQFAGYGFNNENLLISVGSNAPVVTKAGGTQTMTYDTFVISSTPQVNLTTTPQRFVISAANGMFEFGVGATLHVNANQTPGKYSGSFTVTVSYQ